MTSTDKGSRLHFPVDLTILESGKAVRVRRWNGFHFEDFADTVLDVVRVDHPDYDRPLLIGSVARELTTEELRVAYHHRSPVETNFFVAQDTAAMEMPRAWTLVCHQATYQFSFVSRFFTQSDRCCV